MKKNNFSSSILADFQEGVDSEGFASNEFGTSKSAISTVTYYWILSGQSPSNLVRGIWKDDGIWTGTNLWLG